MKELTFLIAQKIATENNPNTPLVCASILKEAFIMQGITKKDANIMAIGLSASKANRERYF